MPKTTSALSRSLTNAQAALDLRALLSAAAVVLRSRARELGVPEGSKAVGAPANLSDEIDGAQVLDQLILYEAECAAKEPAPIISEGDEAGELARVAFERRASLLAQRAAAIFPSAEFVAWLEKGSNLPHSCLPSVQIDASICEEASPSRREPLKASWVSLTHSSREVSCIAWVDAAAPLAVRRHDLQR